MSEYVFFGLSKMRNYLRKAGLDRENKRYIRGERIQRQRINCFSSIFVSFCYFSHFFSTLTSYLKTKATHQTTKRYASNNQKPRIKQLAYFPLLTFFPQNLGMASQKTPSGKTPQNPPLSSCRLTHKNWMCSSGNIDHQAKYLNLHRL